MDDYSIVVEDLPEDVTEDRLLKHFEKFGVVNEIVMGYDLREMMALRRKLLEQEGNHEMLEYMLKRANEMLGIESDYHKERWVKVFEHKAGEGVTLDLGPSAINDMFERTKIWRFDFAGQPRAYYARHGAITNDFDAYANMLKTWSTRDNVPVEDFDVYGSEEDLKNSRRTVDGTQRRRGRCRVSARFGGVRARGWDVGVPPRLTRVPSQQSRGHELRVLPAVVARALRGAGKV